MTLGLLLLAFSLAAPVVPTVAAAGSRPAELDAPIAVVRRLPLAGVRAVVPTTRRLYVLRSVPYPGDPSGNGWQLDLVDPSSGWVLRSIAGDAAPVAMVRAFGSLWVLTGAGAKPGGLGPGIDRIDPTDLTDVARVGLPRLDPFLVAASGSTLWLASGDEVGAFDPRTDRLAQTVPLGSRFLIGAVAAAGSRVVVAGNLFPASEKGRQEQVALLWLDATTGRVVSRLVLAGAFSTSTYEPVSVAPTRAGTLLLGLTGAGPSRGDTAFRQALAVLRGRRVRGPYRHVGADIVVSPNGQAWADHATGPTTTHGVEVQRLGASGRVGATREMPAVTLLAARGRDLWCAGGRNLVELR